MLEMKGLGDEFKVLSIHNFSFSFIVKLIIKTLLKCQCITAVVHH